MMGNCPKCKKEFDLNGFTDSGMPVLYYCVCGAVIVKSSAAGLVEIPKEEVNLREFCEWYVDLPAAEPGIFTIIVRWKRFQEKFRKFASEMIEEYVKENKN